MNKITKYFNDISDDIFREAVSNRRTYNLNKRKYTYEMQAIRLRNGSDKEKESRVQSREKQVARTKSQRRPDVF